MSGSSPKTPPRSIEVTYRGRRAVVVKNDRHPEEYLWIEVEGSRFFLGVLLVGMTRGDVREMGRRWLAEHAAK